MYTEVLIAVYKENRLLAVRKSEIRINAQDNTNISEVFDNIDGADDIKVFAWNCVDSMLPLAKSQIKQIE